ncbi:MAG: hypothetical protein HXS50_01460 [Theionarchaea archaeon]|nr:hypothetical protein [Theionarchaea archaeon]
MATLIIITIARERIEEPIEIFQNEFPPNSPTFKFAIMTRQKFENVQIRFAILWERALEYNQKVDPKMEYNTSSTAEDVLANNLNLRWFQNETSLLDIEPEIFDLEITLEGIPTRILIHDYSSLIDSLSGREAIIGAPLIYGGIIDENGEEYNLEGVSGFFVNPADNILSLRLSRNDEELNYIPDDQIWSGYDRFPLSTAPKGGILDYDGVEKDDRLSVLITAESRVVPEGFGRVFGPGKANFACLEMIRIYLDGELYGEPIINVIKSV